MSFHFSPRPNRAAEIHWNEWGGEAFERARADDKPVLLAISAVWCHWCHVMDETTYSDPQVIAAINDGFVPVRVDNDRRPDVNARYNQGGWPTTAFLSPDGVLLTGATYVPAVQMLSALARVAEFYRERAGEIAANATRATPATPDPNVDPTLPDASVPESVLAAIDARYDETYGGFGDAPKFPMVDALEFLVAEYRATGNQRAYDMAAGSLLGMARGGTYDHVEGGFFRYSTTRDWSIPHFEKMSEDHAGLLRALADLFAATRNEAFRDTLVSALRYVREVLYDPEKHRIAGSQDADETYYRLPLEERRKIAAPAIDRTSYTNWTAGIAGAWFAAANALDDDAIAQSACAVLDALDESLDDGDGLRLHFIDAGGEAQVRGLLGDQTAYMRACIDAHEHTGQPRFLQRALDTAAALQRRLGADGGGFFDREPVEIYGALRFADRPLPDNASAADSLLRLSALTGDASLRESALRTLALYRSTYERAGIFAASFARAVRRAVEPAASVVVVGEPGETAAFREAARRLPGGLASVLTISPLDARALHARGIPAAPAPAAYVCSGSTCGAPVTAASALRAAFDRISSAP